MTPRPPAARMPDSIRHFMRAGQHPARSVSCPHCSAAAHQPCRLRTNGRPLATPHPQRMSAWARLVARCTACQVAPTMPCHRDGRELPSGAVHAQRYTEAEGMAA